MASSSSSSSTTKPTSTSTSKTLPPQKNVNLDNPSAGAGQSEFPDGKVAVGAAMTFVDELKTALPPKKYQQILDLLTSYHSHSLTERDVYVLVRNVLRGVEGEEELLRGFERFLPEDVKGGEEVKEVKGVKE